MHPTPTACPRRPPLHLDQLNFGCRFVVWAVRLWTCHRRNLAGAWEQLQTAFALTRVANGAATLDALLSIVAVAALRPLDVRPIRSRRLGGDEVALLQALALLQLRDYAAAAAILGELLPPAAARIAMDQACLLATALAAAGLRLGQGPKGVHLDRIAPAAATGAPTLLQ